MNHGGCANRMRTHARLGGALLCLFLAPGAWGAGNDGGVLLRMCRGADKVKSLSVMCHSYLNGYLDAARQFGQDGAYCLADGDRERLPFELVLWMAAHPDTARRPAGAVLHQVLSERFPCKGAGRPLRKR